MDAEKFEQLLGFGEKDFIDFKSEIYFTNPAKDKDKARAEFVKDIISMWNTPRVTDAYIVLGVKNSNNGNELIGIDQENMPDDANLRSQFEGLVSYVPRFQLETCEYDNNKFAVFIIPVATNRSTVIKDFSGQTLKKDALYYREGSKNTEAQPGSPKEQEIYKWFSNREMISLSNFSSNEILMSSMENFDSDKYFYFLITSSLGKTNSDLLLKNFSFINWTFVMDFDPESLDNGLLSKCKDNLETRQSLHMVVKGNSPTINSNYGTYWYFASGASGHKETLLSDFNKISWLRGYKKDFEKQIDRLSKALGNKKPIKILVVIENNAVSDILNEIFGSLVSVFQEGLSFLIVSPEGYDALKSIETDYQEYDAKLITMPLAHLCRAFEKTKNALSDTSGGFSIPSSSGTAIAIDTKKTPWLQEELDIVRLDAGVDIQIINTSSHNFLRGHEISWANLQFNHDAVRDETKKLNRLVEEGLRNRKPLRINLYHIPGAGGTTVARRILWNLHKDYPCVVLLSMKNALETMERLSYLTEISQTSVLLLIDGGVISDRQGNELYEKIASSHLPVIMLLAIRKFKLPSFDKVSKNSRFLKDELSEEEKYNFYHLLSKEIPKEKLSLLDDELRKVGCSPFSLGFTTFENEYKGIDNYVKYRLENIKDAHKKIILFLAISYYYGQKSISPQWFYSILDIPSTRHVKLEAVFDQSPITDLIIYDDAGKWRINHFIFAEKCLSYLLSPEHFGKNDDSYIWKQSLSTWAKEFISFCRGKNFDIQPSEEAIEIICRVFYFRDNTELLGTEKSSFSKLIEDINNDNGKLEVFRYLTEVFPDEPQFWAHLGRFYSFVKKDADKALEAIEKALSLNDSDPLIHHMQGMAIRQKVYNLISIDKPNDKEYLFQIVQEAEKASLSFQKNRELNPIDEHGYISEVQMIIKVLNYAGRYFNNKPIDAITAFECPKWLRESLENASFLLAQIRRIRQEDQSSKFEINCQADLDVINENVEDALQKWNKLLESERVSPDDKLSIRRSIVFTRLKKADQQWNNLNDRQIKRVVELLEENLKHGKHDKDLRLWLDAIRVLPNSPHLEEVAEKVSYWKLNTNSLDAVYYLYILQVLQVLSGSLTDFGNAEANIKESHERSRYRRKNEISFEWLGNGQGIKQLIHRENLGEWKDGFWVKT
ncbi:MAG: tetratricopeptide repeat protein, partial [Flavisolibacter sp.]